jgi:hypothetical protein
MLAFEGLFSRPGIFNKTPRIYWVSIVDLIQYDLDSALHASST